MYKLIIAQQPKASACEKLKNFIDDAARPDLIGAKLSVRALQLFHETFNRHSLTYFHLSSIIFSGFDPLLELEDS